MFLLRKLRNDQTTFNRTELYDTTERNEQSGFARGQRGLLGLPDGQRQVKVAGQNPRI